MQRHFNTNQIKKFNIFLNGFKNISSSSSRLSLQDNWKKIATKQLKGQSPDTLIWKTAEVSNNSIEYFTNNYKTFKFCL